MGYLTPQFNFQPTQLQAILILKTDSLGPLKTVVFSEPPGVNFNPTVTQYKKKLLEFYSILHVFVDQTSYSQTVSRVS